MKRTYQKGDTIIEVLLAFAIFALLAVGTTVAMNRGLAMGQQSLERTLVRQQVDSQAELLRYARDADGDAWDDITANLAVNPNLDSFDTCPTSPQGNAFVMNVDTSGPSHEVVMAGLTGPNFQAAGYHSKVDLEAVNSPGSIYAEGLWIQAVRVSVGPNHAYDMYIRACWDSIGSSRPLQVSTIVRLYGQ